MRNDKKKYSSTNPNGGEIINSSSIDGQKIHTQTYKHNNNNELQQFLMSQFKAHSSHLFSKYLATCLSVSFIAFVDDTRILITFLLDFIRFAFALPCVEPADTHVFKLKEISLLWLLWSLNKCCTFSHACNPCQIS